MKRLSIFCAVVAALTLFATPARAQKGAVTDWTFIPAAGCAPDGSGAGTAFDLPSQPRVPRAVCVTGERVRKGVLEFQGGSTVQLTFPLPKDFAADLGVDVTLYWTKDDAAGGVTWSVSTAFTAPGERDDPEWNAPGSITSAAPSVAGALEVSKVAGVPSAGAGPRRLAHLRLSSGGDGAVRLVAVEVVTRRRAR